MIPFSLRIASAFAEVGPFAPSTISLALILGALSLVITSCKAAGTNTSTSNVNNCSLVIFSAFL
ncbi:hypothetical protein D3C78_1753360 [compost metagenome]